MVMYLYIYYNLSYIASFKLYEAWRIFTIMIYLFTYAHLT